MKNKFLVWLILSIFLINSVFAVCTISLDKTSYAPTETVTAEISCSETIEKIKIYSLNWTFNGIDNYEWDIGITPSNVGQNFYETFVLNSTYDGTINVSMNGTNLEGSSGADVTRVLIDEYDKEVPTTLDSKYYIVYFVSLLILFALLILILSSLIRKSKFEFIKTGNLKDIFIRIFIILFILIILLGVITGLFYGFRDVRDSFNKGVIDGEMINGSVNTQKGASSFITGGVVDEYGREVPIIFGSRYYSVYFISLLILFTLLILIVHSLIRKSKFEFMKTGNLKDIFIRIFIILFILIIFLGVITGLFYGFKVVSDGFSIGKISDSSITGGAIYEGEIEGVIDEEIDGEISYAQQKDSILKDRLFRSMILIGFIVLMIIILFKSLNIRGELKFGNNKRIYEDRRHTKLQNKLNRMLIKDEIKRQKKKKHYNIKKMSAEDFFNKLNKLGK
jgi:hypothetical protein